MPRTSSDAAAAEEARVSAAAIPRQQQVEPTEAMNVMVEKLLARLPAGGATLAIGSVSGSPDDHEVAEWLARGLERITSQPVLLMDFARPDGSSRGAVSSDQAGVLDILRGSATLEQALRPAGSRGVSILGCGPDGTDSAQLIASSSFRDLVRQTRERFPWVLLHCASLTRLDAAAPLISRADGAVVTLKQGQARGRDLLAVTDLCAELKIAFLGVVLT